jgi:hypothetical protein
MPSIDLIDDEKQTAAMALRMAGNQAAQDAQRQANPGTLELFERSAKRNRELAEKLEQVQKLSESR